MPRLTDPAKAKPRAVARILRQQIRRGEYRAGEPLPSLAALAKDLGVSEWTTRRAARLLVQKGLLEPVAGRGFHVRRRRPRPAVGVLFGGAMRSTDLSPFYRMTLSAAQAELKRRGCRPRIYAPRSPDMAEHSGVHQLIRDVRRGLLGGLFTIAWSPTAERGADPTTPQGLVQLIIDSGIPYTGISSSDRIPAAVGTDTDSGVRRLTRRLLEAGARDVYLMLFGDGQTSGSPGVRGFYEALAERGLPGDRDRLVLTAWPDDRHGYETFVRWWASRRADEGPLGLAVMDDMVARGVVLAALERQVAIPEQLRLGMLSIRGAETFCPRPVVRLEVDPQAMVAESVDRLMRMMRDPTQVPDRKRMESRIVESAATTFSPS